MAEVSGPVSITLVSGVAATAVATHSHDLFWADDVVCPDGSIIKGPLPGPPTGWTDHPGIPAAQWAWPDEVDCLVHSKADLIPR